MIDMAKFCGNCGSQLDDDARVCGQCGTPIDGNEGKIPGLKVVDPEKQKKQKKKVKRTIVLLTVVFIAIVGIKVILSFTGINGLVRKVMVAYENYDIDRLVTLSSDMYYYSDDENYVDDYFGYAVGNNIDYYESAVGHNYKMSYEVEEIYDLSQRRQDEIINNIESIYPDFDVDIISKMAVANVKITVKQEGEMVSQNVMITMSKEEGTWRLLYLE